MRALIIRDIETQSIRTAVAEARRHPIPWEQLAPYECADKNHLKLTDRKPGLDRPPSQEVLLPIGYRACISFEQQPEGSVRHLSVSVDEPGLLPSHEAFKVIAREFGFELNQTRPCKAWIEEFESGHDAVHLIELE